MKRYGSLYEKIYDLENLRLAHQNARKGKSFYKEVRMVNSNSDFYLGQIYEMLKSKTYRTSPYEVFKKIDRNKEREIFKLPYFPDRIVHWAIMQVVEPLWMKVFIFDTYSSIKGRGIHSGLKRLHKAMKDKEGTKYCLKLDIKKFYPSINHEILRRIIRKKIKDKDLLWLLDEIIDSTDGVPIGNYLSQYFGNLYLSYFDHWLKEQKKIKCYFRYCDDCVILHHDKQFLHKLNLEIKNYLWDSLRLRVKENWQVFPSHIRGIDFLGYRSFGEYTLLRKSTTKNLKQRMWKLKNKQVLSKGNVCSIMSYEGWLKWCNAYNLKKKYILPLLGGEEVESRKHSSA